MTGGRVINIPNWDYCSYYEDCPTGTKRKVNLDHLIMAPGADFYWVCFQCKRNHLIRIEDEIKLAEKEF